MSTNIPHILTSSHPNILLPKHIAIIMDGNGRWAKQRNLPRSAGHEAGAKTVEEVIKLCGDKGIEILTLFAFSNENWGRPDEEIEFLMELFLQTLQQRTQTLHENNIQIRFIGDYTRFNEKLQQNIIKAQQLTANNAGLKLNVAINYSGRWDITEAARQIAQLVANKKITANEITPETFQNYLSLAGLPDPDLMIRTSGEQRVSNFMLWQFAYTEFYFTSVHWPDFNKNAFEEALMQYATRQRRFGLTAEQLSSMTQQESAYEYDSVEV